MKQYAYEKLDTIISNPQSKFSKIKKNNLVIESLSINCNIF